MKHREVVFAPEARDDLLRFYHKIAREAGTAVALTYVERIERYCLRFDLAAERGHTREDVRIGLRIVGFKRHITIAFTVNDDRVTILRLFRGGQDWEGAFA